MPCAQTNECRAAKERRTIPSAVSWIVCVLSFLWPVSGDGSTPNFVYRIAVGVEAEQIIGDSNHFHEFSIEAGPWLVDVEQLEGDVILAVFDGADRKMAEVDSLFDGQGRERLAFTIEEPLDGRIGLRLRPGFSQGRYRVVLRRATGSPPRWAAELASTRAGALAAQVVDGGDAVVLEQAISAYEIARDAWQRVGESRGEIEAIHALALLHMFSGERDKAVVLIERATEGWRHLGDDTFQASALNDWALLRRDLGGLDDAASLLNEAIDLYLRDGNVYGVQVARLNRCGLDHRRGRLEEAFNCYQELLPAMREMGSAFHLGNLLNSLGGVHYQRGEVEPAKRRYAEALDQHRLSGDLRQRSAVLNNRAALHRYTGSWGKAVADYEAALDLQRQVGDRVGEGRALNNLGHGLLTLGESELARDYFEQALELRRAVGDLAGQAVTLNNLGTLYQTTGNGAKALAFRRRALEIRRRLGLSRHEALTHLWMARDLRSLGRPEDALTELQAAMDGLSPAGDRRFAAHALADRGRLLTDLGKLDGARRDLLQAREIQGRLGDLWGEVESLVSLAEIEARSEDWQAAQERAEAAIEILEELRHGVPDLELRGTFLAAKGRAFELAVQAAMARHEGTPTAGHDRRGFALNEASRARALIDLLAAVGDQSTAHGTDRSDPKNLLEQELRLLDARRLRASSRSTEEAKVLSLEERQGALRRRLEELETSAGDPIQGALGRVLTTEGIQGLLGPGVAVLEIALGEPHSYLWLVTSDDLKSVRLPGREALEALALSAHGELAAVTLGATSDDADSHRALRRLSALVLEPLMEELRPERAAQRWIVVADGALHYIPFAALWLPTAEPVRVMERFEVVHLPSASTLGVLAKGPVRWDTSSLMVFADPVFSSRDRRFPAPGKARTDDPRWSEVRGSSAPGGSPTELEFERLSGSGDEATAIAALWAPERVTVVRGFEATRGRVFDEQTAVADIVHFATHGWIDSRQPARSGLMLSRWDAGGHPLAGFLSLEDIYRLQLQADLVVLSGCRTALGKEVSGEGLMGISRGFLQAGARAVLASLWRVEDRATAELMRHFYRALLQHGASPAAALRIAQGALAADPRFSDPYYWAGFIVQGDGMTRNREKIPDPVRSRSGW